MAKVAKPSSVPSSSHQLGSGPLKTGSMARKKTPSELRTRRLRSFYDVDNSPESLLAFSGNNNVHALYDFLLNYSFVTEPSSIGLNVALKSTCEKPESKAAGSESLQDHGSTFGIPEAVVTSRLCSCSLKGVSTLSGMRTC
ncbi:hypothetical protein GLYMA_10G214400v4 [Glycine max]|uniref:Uncharacterized protein n=1 Tax=Glycine max TaxID=3847 RepID=A0A0R0HWW1_SOYBN|nr:uncharacterized protein LOC100782210 [Glycine max]KAH1139424.1 hypothetical protein GYH30_028704 [Glycine max]KRH34940.1 hypothetical protein GLYMA_10G214400v4 [Glycine max]